MADERAARRRAYLTPPAVLVASGAIVFVVIAALVLLQSFGVWPFGDDEPAVQDTLEEDWGDRNEEDVTFPGEPPTAYLVDGLAVTIGV